MTQSYFDTHAFKKGDWVKLPDDSKVEIAQVDLEERQIKVRGAVYNIISFSCEDVDIVK